VNPFFPAHASIVDALHRLAVSIDHADDIYTAEHRIARSVTFVRQSRTTRSSSLLILGFPGEVKRAH